jgi:hypothetical protein
VSDSIHGSAMVTPTPRRKARRENWWVLIRFRFRVRRSRLIDCSQFNRRNMDVKQLSMMPPRAMVGMETDAEAEGK